jgi:hypothetical protein
MPEVFRKMTSRSVGSLLVLLPLALASQSLQERSVPLHNWSAPRKVRRSELQTQQRTPTPKFQLPGGVTSDVLVFVPLAPCRVADTRPGSGYPALGSTPLAALTPRTLPIAGSCGVPSPNPVFGGPEAYSLNVTVVPPSGTLGGYLLVYPNPVTPIPLVASMTWNPGASFQSNAVITAASLDGSVNVAADFATNVVIDINGYYAAPTDPGDNTALGLYALPSDVVNGASGTANTAVGYGAMGSNISGQSNTAVGYLSLDGNSDGSDNVALGFTAMQLGLTGGGNTAVGAGALQNTSGDYNTGIGDSAGANLTTGHDNIMIGNEGTSSDDHTIRIGDVQTSTYIAGILGNNLSGASTVVINANGQMGVQSEPTSSRRYKDDIQTMGDASKGLLRLRPVTFHYKKPDADGSKPLEYGLIAEEVAEVYPELVVRGKDGQVETVQYSKLPAMLLNELQKQDETIRKLENRLAVLEAQLANATAKTASGKTPPSSGGGR